VDVTNSRKWEAGLVGALSVLTAAMLILVEITPSGSDRFVWLGGLVVMAAAGVLWRLKRWPANPWVVIVSSVGVVVVGYAIWLWWYTATHVPHSV
jgi:high-affinity Fe2+/Pb2+ permease